MGSWSAYDETLCTATKDRACQSSVVSLPAFCGRARHFDVEACGRKLFA